LNWGEARSRAGLRGSTFGNGRSMIALALFRVERYADALAMLQMRELPKFAKAAGMLMSPWNVLVVDAPVPYVFWDGDDLIVRAMCHHRLGQPQEAAARLHLARKLWGTPEQRTLQNVGLTHEQLALLHEAETLIEGKARP
jgi:hypothetical protein